MTTQDPDQQREWTWQGIESFARRVSRSASETMTSAASATAGIIPSRASVSGWLESGGRELARIQRVKTAISRSDDIARVLVFERLKGLGIEDIWPILIQVLKDIALYWGGAVVVGALVGGVAGAFFGGAGAVPGAMAGGAIGNQVGIWILALLGLKSLVDSLADLIPAACRRYEEGFRKAWDGPEQTAARPAAHNGRDAAQEFAEGHVLLLIALLMSIVTYLTRGRGDRAKLFTEIRDSKRLGPKVAVWLEKHEAQLVKHAALRKPMAKAGGGTSSGTSATAGRGSGAALPGDKPPTRPPTASKNEPAPKLRAPNKPRQPRTYEKKVVNEDGSTTYTLKTETGGTTQVTYRNGYPDFAPLKYNGSQGRNEVAIDMTGNNSVDFKRANQAAGFGDGANSHPSGYTWHHHQDNRTMQLIRTDAHDAAPHTGGASSSRRTGGSGGP